jgi:hypothetical protein
MDTQSGKAHIVSKLSQPILEQAQNQEKGVAKKEPER